MSFNINFYSRVHNYHRFSSNDFALRSIGISNYTTSSIEAFFGKRPPNPDLKEFFGDLKSTQDKLLGVGKETSLEIMEFNQKSKKYEVVTGFSKIKELDRELYKPDKFPPISDSTLKDFLESWDEVQLGVIGGASADTYKAIAYRIQTSISGGISFVADTSVLGSTRNMNILLSLTDYKDSESDRTLAFKGAPLYTAVPETMDGLLHGIRDTLNSPPGAYIPPTAGGLNNPQNTASAQLDMAYNRSSNKWEAGTRQILVRLTTDIEPANIPNFTGEELLSFSREDYYDGGEEGLGFMGQFKTGSGIPLSKENGNPYLYGPNFIGNCDDNKNIRQIKIVNRSNARYKEGDLVMCSKIDDEWVPMDNGTGEEQDPNKKSVAFGNFEYQQFVIPIKWYFLFNRYRDNNLSYGTISNNDPIPDLRNFYYTDIEIQLDPKFHGNYSDIDLYELTRLNLYISTLDDSIDKLDMIKKQFKKTDLGPILKNANDNRIDFDGLCASLSYGIDPIALSHKDLKSETAFPKNILARNSRKIVISDDSTGRGPDTAVDLLYGIEVPLFWGMLFPDGYKADGTSKFIGVNPQLQNIPIFAGDMNLVDLSVVSTSSMIDFKDPVKNLLSVRLYSKSRGKGSGEDIFSYSNGVYQPTQTAVGSITPSDLVKKSGGIFTHYSGLRLTLKETARRLGLISFSDSSSLYYMYNFFNRVSNEKENVFGLEPLKPNRLQFSPMSLEALYFKSTIVNTNYSNLKSSVEFLRFFTGKTISSSNTQWKSGNLFDYSPEIFPIAGPDAPFPAQIATDPVDAGNIYPYGPLSVSDAMTNVPDFVNRVRPAPLGIVSDMLPSIYGGRRSIAIPVLACKSTIRTSAQGLRFDIRQFCGMNPKITISPGVGPQVTVLPLGGGLTWVDQPTVPGTERGIPQWGDPNRSDDIDSCGTTALHVKAYENWPPEQTFYLGSIFTVLHFNPSAPDYEYVIEYDQSGNPIRKFKTQQITDANGNVTTKNVEAVSPVDFKVPTNKSGQMLAKDTTIASGVLAPYNDWAYNKIRRGQLLSGGGFAYERNIIGINTDTLRVKPNKDEKTKNEGSSYRDGDKFRFPDGTVVECTVGGKGEVTGFKNPVQGDLPNIRAWSDNIQPSYLGSTGKGLVVQADLKVVSIYGYDAPPKQVVPKTRLTKKSSPLGFAEGTISTSVDLGNESKKAKSYDLFYFFHNDPSHYSIDWTNPFNGGWAQYVISEVNGE